MTSPISALRFGDRPLRAANENGPCLLVALVAGLDDREFEVTEGALRTLGFEACRADDGLQAMQMASNYGLDLIISAIAMPRMDGIELMGLVQRGAFGSPPPPMVVFAGEEDVRLFWETAGGGAFAAAVKRPINCDELLAALADLLPLD